MQLEKYEAAKAKRAEKKAQRDSVHEADAYEERLNRKIAALTTCGCRKNVRRAADPHQLRLEFQRSVTPANTSGLTIAYTGRCVTRSG